MNGASELLELEDPVGVASSEALVQLMVNDKYLVGLDFHHDNIVDVSVPKIVISQKSITSKK